jgi:hypothetical protein
MRIPPVAGDSPLWRYANGQSSEFGSNHEQRGNCCVTGASATTIGNGVAGVELQVDKQVVYTGGNGEFELDGGEAEGLCGAGGGMEDCFGGSDRVARISLPSWLWH